MKRKGGELVVQGSGTLEKIQKLDSVSSIILGSSLVFTLLQAPW